MVVLGVLNSTIFISRTSFFSYLLNLTKSLKVCFLSLPHFCSAWNCLSTTAQSLPVSWAPALALLSSPHNAFQILCCSSHCLAMHTGCLTHRLPPAVCPVDVPPPLGCTWATAHLCECGSVSFPGGTNSFIIPENMLSPWSVTYFWPLQKSWGTVVPRQNRGEWGQSVSSAGPTALQRIPGEGLLFELMDSSDFCEYHLAVQL